MPNMVGNSLSWGMYFLWYGNVKDLIASARGLQGKEKEKLPSSDYFFAAGASGVLTAVVTNPIWVIKTRMLSTARNTPGAYRSSLHGASELLKTEGLRGFYRGLTPSLLGVSHGAIQFMAYENLKNHWGLSRSGGKDGLTNRDYVFLSAVSKMFAGSITYPYQVVRARLQTYDAQTKYKGVVDVIKQVARHEGISGFYKGYDRLFRLSEISLTQILSQTRAKPSQGSPIDLRNFPGLRERKVLLATHACARRRRGTLEPGHGIEEQQPEATIHQEKRRKTRTTIADLHTTRSVQMHSRKRNIEH